MPNLLDLMTEEDRQAVKGWTKTRQNPAHKQDIPTPLFIAAQLGYYYGWGAVQDFRRGYSLGYEYAKDKDGNLTGELKLTRYKFDLEEAVGLIEAARKLHYNLKLTEGKVFAANNASCMDPKNANRVIKDVAEFAENI